MFKTNRKSVQGYRTQDGAGVSLVRVLSAKDVEDYDPFLMMDSFDSTDPEDYYRGFPMHPHRGIETITYLIHGEIDHEDSLGNKGTIHDGDSQWMTAGSGILHQEMPQEAERMLGLQIWLNLPKSEKMTSPKYFDIKGEDVPEVKTEDYTVKVISGKFEDAQGAKPHHIQATIFDIDLKDGKEIEIPSSSDESAFVFTILGEAEINDELIKEKTAVLFRRDGDSIKIKASNGDTRVIYFQAPALRQPIAWGGPIVMNTNEELNLAFQELKDGTFIKEQPEGEL